MREDNKKNYRQNRQIGPGRPRGGIRRGPAAAARDERSEEERALILEGKNAVEEALESGRETDKLLFAPGSQKPVG